jgi:hypothetical protein
MINRDDASTCTLWWSSSRGLAQTPPASSLDLDRCCSRDPLYRPPAPSRQMPAQLVRCIYSIVTLSFNALCVP